MILKLMHAKKNDYFTFLAWKFKFNFNFSGKCRIAKKWIFAPKIGFQLLRTLNFCSLSLVTYNYGLIFSVKIQISTEFAIFCVSWQFSRNITQIHQFCTVWFWRIYWSRKWWMSKISSLASWTKKSFLFRYRDSFANCGFNSSFNL